MPDVIVFASRKGGAGKTTLAGHLAVEAGRAGRKVAVIDTDSQGSLTAWWNERSRHDPDAAPAFAALGLSNLARDLPRLRQEGGFDLVIIDTRGDITDDITKAVAVASLVIVPVRPSPHDLRAVGKTLEIIGSHKKPLTFVLNAAAQKARMTQDALMALAEHGTIARPVIINRQIYAESMIDGRTAGELDATCKAAAEMAELWQSVATRLDRLRAGLVTA